MVVHTIIDIVNRDDQIVRSYKTNKFNEASKMENITDYISRKDHRLKPPLDIRILDQPNGYVTLDGDHLEEYHPFDTKNTEATTIQSIASSERPIKLRVILSDHNPYSSLNQQYNMFQNEIREATARVESIQRPITVRLSKDPQMGFVIGCNVNDKHRDQYTCDQVSVDTGVTTGTLSMIQGQKNETDKYKSILPRFRIQHDGIKDTINHKWTLLVNLTHDVYQFGKRSLFYDSERTFVPKDNLEQQSSPYEIPITTDAWMNATGMELKLTTVVIEGAKKHHTGSRTLLCNLDTNESSCNYSRSCLALVLCKDGHILWETLVLSNEMVFIKNPPTKTSLKRSRSKKCQNISNKRAKLLIAKDHSSRINLPANDSDVDEPSVFANQGLPVHYNKNPMINIIPRITSNTSASSSTNVFDSTPTNDLHEHTTDILNILTNDFNFPDITGTPDFLLNDDDLSFDVTHYLDVDT